MKSQGEALYGLDAYGPGGTIIDTNMPFNVRVEFVSDKKYSELWSIRTRLKQGEDKKKQMLLTAYCPG